MSFRNSLLCIVKRLLIAAFREGSSDAVFYSAPGRSLVSAPSIAAGVVLSNAAIYRPVE